MVMIIDNAVQRGIANAAAVHFPQPDWEGWHKYDDPNARKYGQAEGVKVGPLYQNLMWQMVTRVGDMVGPNCFPDFTLYGAGFHRMERGGYLKPHLDSAMHKVTGWKREWSATLFLSPEWQDAMGGHLLLDKPNTTEIISPLFNRLVLFRCTESAKHEVTEILGDVPRLSFALFYFSLDEPNDPTRTQARFFDD